MIEPNDIMIAGLKTHYYWNKINLNIITFETIFYECVGHSIVVATML